MAEHGLTFEYPVICGELRAGSGLISFAGSFSALIAHHQYLSAVFVHDDTLFTFSHRLSMACEKPEFGLTTPAWFYRTLESVRFD